MADVKVIRGAELDSTSRLRARIEGKDSKLLTDIVEVKERWMEHFSELLEGDGGGSKASVSSTPHGYLMSFWTWMTQGARAQFKGRVCLDNCTMQLLTFGDDTVLLAETEEDLQHNVREFSEAVK